MDAGRWEGVEMSMLSLHTATMVALVLAAAYAMTGAGLAKHRLVWRSQRCRVCHRPRNTCVCKWR